MPKFYLFVDQAALEMLSTLRHSVSSGYYRYSLEIDDQVILVVRGQLLEDCLETVRQVEVWPQRWVGSFGWTRFDFSIACWLVIVRGDLEEPDVPAETLSHFLARVFPRCLPGMQE